MILCVVMLVGLLPTLVPHEVHAATTSQNNIVARADYMYNLTWVAKSTVSGWNYNYTFYAGNTYHVPYGQPINSGAYIGFAVDIDTFLNAANTAGSVFYTSRSTYNSTSSVYYATDCSAFVSWCWGTTRKTTYSIPQVSTYIGMATASNASLLQLGDCLNSNDVGHVVLVTDLKYSGSTLTSIEITEQTPPQLKRSTYTPSELGAKYGTYYGIYRYSGTVPAAPDGSTNDDSGSTPGTSTTITSKYYPACASSYTSLIPAMASIGVTMDWELQTRIAKKNGITGFSGTVEQNTQLLNLLKAGQLLNPDYVPVSYYPACASSCITFYEGMSNIGISCDWTLHCEIAAANGITNFSGTAAQNESLLALLKAGKLIIPGTGSGDDSGSTGSGTVTSGSNGYERGYAGGMAGTGEYKAFGLDVSSWQGSSLNFQRIKNAGYDYVILRAGTTKGKDECFETYYTNAKAAGLDVGAYYYSYATSVSAVKTDMEDFLSYIAGKKFEYPIYFDYEDASQQALSASLSQQICLTAMDMLAAEGYLVGMYTGKYFSTQLPMSTICARYEAWIAHYLAVGDGSYDGTYDYTTYGPTYSTQFGMYQFTDSVWINGYGPYDGDVCYKDYPSIVKTYGFNGYEAEVKEETYFDKCTFYPSRVKIEVVEDTYICSEPRSQKTGNTSVNLEAVKVGATFTTTGLYQNSGDNIWYQVQTSDGKTGYIYAGRVKYLKKAYDDIKIANYDVPNAHVKGNYFLVTGTITSTYNVITEARVYIYSGFGVSGNPVTGGSDTISNNKYVLDGSSIDDATLFGSLAAGKYTYVISAPYYSYYADTNQSVAKVSGTRTIKKAYFTVVNSSVNSSTCSHKNSETVIEAATCTATGTKVVSCSVCGLTQKVSIDITAHNYGSYKTTVAATCTTDGSKEKTCADCGKVYTKTIAATGHSYGDASCTEAAVCTVCGVSTGSSLGHTWADATCTDPQTCIRCGATQGSKLGHSYTAATCDSAKTCTRCGTTSGNPLGHSYTGVITAPTCTKDGYTTYTCTTCKDSYIGDTVASTGHKWSSATCTAPATCSVCGITNGSAANHNYQSVVTPVGCLTDGYTTYTCTSCNHSYTSDYVTASGHKYTSVVTPVECLKDGYTTYTCTACGHKYNDNYITASGHKWNQATCTDPMTCSVCFATSGTALGHSYKSVVTEPGCQSDGYTTYTCTICKHSYKDNYITAAGHEWTAATCLAPMTCKNCGTTVGTAADHIYDSGKITTDPTCTEDGVKTYTCGTCGETKTESVAATGHSYVDGVCGTCGAADPDYVMPIVKPNLTLSYPTLNFKDVVYYNVYYQVSDMTDVVEMGLITFDGALSTGTIDDAAEVITGYIASGSNYMVHTNGINAKNLGDALYFKVYAKLSDGSYVYSDLAGYHAVAYAKDILANSTNAKMKSLVVAMLNYGAAAQVQFEYKTDSLMNAFLSDAQNALVADYSADMVAPVTKVDSSKIGSFAYVSGGYSALYPSVSFEGAFSVKFYFTPAKAMDGDLTMYYWSAADYAAADVLTAENATGVFTMDAISGTYVATVEGIAARQIDETIYVAGIYESNGVSYPTGVIAYSLGTYCLDRVANGTGNMPAFSKATIVYGNYAKAYFA